jgi:hypothetical protein
MASCLINVAQGQFYLCRSGGVVTIIGYKKEEVTGGWKIFILAKYQ